MADEDEGGAFEHDDDYHDDDDAVDDDEGFEDQHEVS